MPSFVVGGMEGAVLRLLAGLAERGAGVHGVTSAWWGASVRERFERMSASTSTICVVPPLRPGSLIPAGLRRMTGHAPVEQRLAEIAAHCDPTHILATQVNYAYRARHLARHRKRISVFRVPNPPDPSLVGNRQRFQQLIWRSIHSDYDVIVCNADYTARLVAQTVGTDRKIRVVRNLAPERPIADPKPFPTLPPDRFRIAYIGQIAPSKGLDELILATRPIVKQDPSVDILIAGKGHWNDKYEEKLRARIQQDGLENRIYFLGHIEDVKGLLSQCHVHVCPSISPGDSFPNVILDAKSAGLPSVVFPTAGLPEAVRTGVDGIVCEDQSPVKLESALRILLSQPDMTREMGIAALRSIQDYSAERILGEWLRLLRPDGWKAWP